MKDHKDGGPAADQLTIPIPATLRDWFAGQALAGIAGNPDMRLDEAESAKAAYVVADRMIEARER